MTCKKCRTKMVEQRHICHKQRKWICPTCKRVRMQKPKTKI